MRRFDTVFLDRDGTLNRRVVGDWIREPEDFILLPGVGETLGRWTRAGLRLIVVSNQRGLQIGRLTRPQLDRVHAHMHDLLAPFGARLDAVYVAETGTGPRTKPAPGMLLDARNDFPAIDFARSVMIGDALRDVEAGAAVGCATILLATDEQREPLLTEARARSVRVDHLLPALTDCTPVVLSTQN